MAGLTIADTIFIQRAIAGVENAIRLVANKAADVGSQVATMGSQIATLQNHQVQFSERLESLIHDFVDFVRADALHKQVQLSETRLVKVRQQLESQFGYYAEVRRSATGILQGFDQNLVSQFTVQFITEEMVMKTPGYWLSPAILTLAAWGRDDSALADRAVAEALRRDEYKTSLFFTLITRRRRRHEATEQWFKRYLEQQDLSALDREFVVLLDGIANELFGPSLLKLTIDTIDRWLVEMAIRTNFVSEQVARWIQSLDGLTPRVGENEYPLLRNFSTNWVLVESSLAQARRNQIVGDFFGKIFEGPLTISPQIEKDVDKILESLVTNFDDEELPLRAQERYLQLIIDQKGDEAAAKKAYDAELRNFDEKVTFTELLSNAVMNPELSKASLGTRRLSASLSGTWIVAAYDYLTTSSRTSYPPQIDIKIQNWAGSSVDGTNENELLSKMNAHFQNVEQKAIGEVKHPILTYLILGASAIFVAWGKAHSFLFLPILLLSVVGIFAVFKIIGRMRRISKIKERIAAEKDNCVKVLRAVLSEVVALLSERTLEDAKAATTRTLLTSISTGKAS